MKLIKSKVLHNVTPGRAAHFRGEAEIRGLDVKGPDGNFRFEGCVINYAYDEKAQTVVLNPSIPLLTNEEDFWKRVDELLADGELPERQGGHNDKPSAAKEGTKPVELKDLPEDEIDRTPKAETAPQPAGEPVYPLPESQDN